MYKEALFKHEKTFRRGSMDGPFSLKYISIVMLIGLGIHGLYWRVNAYVLLPIHIKKKDLGCSSIAFGMAVEVGPLHDNKDGKSVYLNHCIHVSLPDAGSNLHAYFTSKSMLSNKNSGKQIGSTPSGKVNLIDSLTDGSMEFVIYKAKEQPVMELELSLCSYAFVLLVSIINF